MTILILISSELSSNNQVLVCIRHIRYLILMLHKIWELYEVHSYIRQLYIIRKWNTYTGYSWLNGCLLAGSCEGSSLWYGNTTDFTSNDMTFLEGSQSRCLDYKPETRDGRKRVVGGWIKERGSLLFLKQCPLGEGYKAFPLCLIS